MRLKKNYFTKSALFNNNNNLLLQKKNITEYYLQQEVLTFIVFNNQINVKERHIMHGNRKIIDTPLVCAIFMPYFKVSISRTTRSRWGMIHFSLHRIRSVPNRWRFNISRFRVFYRTSIRWCICLSCRFALHRLSTRVCHCQWVVFNGDVATIGRTS